ncbi:rhomboid family intramembrane serine protease [Mesorhizobium xinjiangense]|uniref:rhomboid family intramembrane serine protease n=1 Tax=Mesorhizobium xinjiangense TaxID=2678685 RepID=UPI0012EDF335|nr:rhomboid family intramembrane serine protease [Mesorhizobium xinjiangense]
MFIPLHDANTLKHIKLQYVTIGLIAANVLVYALTAFGSEATVMATVYGLGYVPAVVNDVAELPPNLVFLPEDFTYITYSFLHADLFHLGGNMLFLWVFGDNVEDAMGHVRYLIFYLLCAAAGAWFHGLLAPSSEIPLIGASGAVAGIVAAYLMLHPRVKVWVLAFGRIPLRIPAFIPLALWIAFQLVMLAVGGEDEVSWSTHVGGILAGAVLVLFFRRRGVPLFDRAVVTPRAVMTVPRIPASR